MKGTGMRTAASAIRGMRRIVEEIDRLAAGLSLWANLPGSLRDALQNGELPKEVWE